MCTYWPIRALRANSQLCVPFYRLRPQAHCPRRLQHLYERIRNTASTLLHHMLYLVAEKKLPMLGTRDGRNSGRAQ